VFIDETWAKTNMVRLRGRAPRGQRLREKVPHGHWNSDDLYRGAAMRRIEAPCVLDQPVNGKSFLQYVPLITPKVEFFPARSSASEASARDGRSVEGEGLRRSSRAAPPVTAPSRRCRACQPALCRG
jgi:hypothetical protein